MNGSAASVAYVILAVFLGGLALGVIAIMAVAMRKEDRQFSVSGVPAGAAARGARWLTRYGGAGSGYLSRDRGER